MKIALSGEMQTLLHILLLTLTGALLASPQTSCGVCFCSSRIHFSPLSTPTESRHTTCLLRGKSPSVKSMSRRENKNVGKTNLKNMGRTMHGLQHIGSNKELRPKNS